MTDIAIDFHNIDSKRVYATGWSNGCAMAQALANKARRYFGTDRVYVILSLTVT